MYEHYYMHIEQLTLRVHCVPRTLYFYLYTIFACQEPTWLYGENTWTTSLQYIDRNFNHDVLHKEINDEIQSRFEKTSNFELL